MVDSTPRLPQPLSHEGDDAAFELLAAFLGNHSPDDHAALEELCRANPSVAARLRSVHASLTALSLELPGPLDDGARTVSSHEVDAGLWDYLKTTGVRGSRYETRGEVASGGMGVILRVWDGELRRHLAMKVMRHSADSGTQRRRFLFEAQLTGQLDHPGIVPVHEIGLCAGLVPYFTMPLIRGHHFGQILAWSVDGQHGWTRLRAIDVLRKVCDTIRFAHDRGVVHRDLKPANIMVGLYGEVFVMDWGLARQIGRRSGAREPRSDAVDGESVVGSTSPLATHDGDVVGTPSYMSPEQAAGQLDLIDERTDVYALGAILYHLLVGHPPYSPPGTATDSETVLRGVRAGPPPRVRDLLNGGAAELGAICDKAMAREQAARFQTVGEFADDLQAYVDGRVVRAFARRRFVRLSKFSKWVRRNRALAATGMVAGAATVAALVVLILYFAHIRTGREQRATLNLLRSLIHFEEQCSTAPPAGSPSATAWFLAEARGLVEGGNHRGDGLLAYERQLTQLLHDGIGTEPRNAPPYDGRPLAEAMQRKIEELAWRRRMLELEPWPTAEAVERRLGELGVPQSFSERCRLAFYLINPDRYRRFGDEQAAVRLADCAEQATTNFDRMRHFDTWAFALSRVGKFSDGLSKQRIALSHAQQYARAGLSEDGKSVHEWLRSIEDNLRVLERLAYTHTTEAIDRVAILEAELARLGRTQFEHAFLFRDHAATLQHAQLLDVVERLRRIQRRLNMAIEATETTKARSAWKRVANEVGADPRFVKVKVSPQLDLLPLGRDSESGLQEFAHLPTGFPPRRGTDGRLVLTANSCIVFILVPPADDAPPFFLSKYEITMAQWARMAEIWPVADRDTSSTHAVERISWCDADKRLRSAGSWLRMPSEGEWMRAFAAGRDADWHIGTSMSTLRETDTFDRLGPVDQRRPNPWGFYEMLGNVTEYAMERVTSKQAIELPRRILGWSRSSASVARSPRSEIDERNGMAEVGLRAARSLLP